MSLTQDFVWQLNLVLRCESKIAKYVDEIASIETQQHQRERVIARIKQLLEYPADEENQTARLEQLKQAIDAVEDLQKRHDVLRQKWGLTREELELPRELMFSQLRRLLAEFQLLDAGHGDSDDGHVPWNTPQQQEQEITEPDPKTPTPSETARDPAEAAKEEAIEKLNEREPQVQKARDRVESWSTYYETKLNDFYADKAGGAIETTKTQFDIALFQEQQDATRDLIEAEKKFEQAREEARAHGFIRDVYKLDSNFPEHVDNGYHVSEDAKDIENVDRDRIQKWLDEGEDRPGYSTDCDEWEWKPLDEGDSISVVAEGRERKWREKWRVICEARAEPEAFDEE